MAAETALIEAAGGDFEKIVIAIMLLFLIGMIWYLVQQMPKEWEKSTDRIVAKICEVVERQDKILGKQEALEDSYKSHDFQAKQIKENLDNRPCINGKR